MTSPTVPPASRTTPTQVSDEKYSASLFLDGGAPRVQFRGTISTVNPATVLNPFVDQVHDQVTKAGAKQVLVDFQELEFCNSSGFKSFIHWIQRIQELPDAQRYTLKFSSNAQRKWQRTSLLALSCYGISTVTME